MCASLLCVIVWCAGHVAATQTLADSEGKKCAAHLSTEGHVFLQTRGILARDAEMDEEAGFQASQGTPLAGPLKMRSGSYRLPKGYYCGKSASTDIHYPSNLDQGPFPIASFGHGSGKGIPMNWIKNIVSLGFVVVVPRTGNCNHHWDDILHAIDWSRSNSSLHPALSHIDWDRAAIFGHSFGAAWGGWALNRWREHPEKYNFTLKAYVAGHAKGGDSGGACSGDDVSSCGPPVMWRMGHGDRKGRLIPESFRKFRGPYKVLVEAEGARHMEPFQSDRLNPFAAHFMGCHVANLQKSCGMVYGDAPETMCYANKMKRCNVKSPYVPCATFIRDACALYTRCSWNGSACLDLLSTTMAKTTTVPSSAISTSQDPTTTKTLSMTMPKTTAAPSSTTSTSQNTTTTNTSTASYIMADKYATCSKQGFADVTESNCQAACESQGYTSYKSGSWNHNPKCFAVVSGPWKGNCHWNTKAGAGSYNSRGRALCVGIMTGSTTTMIGISTTIKGSAQILPAGSHAWEIQQTWSQGTHDRHVDVFVRGSGGRIIIGLHGAGGSGNAKHYAGFGGQDVIVAAPSGYNRGWNCGRESTKAPDVALIEAIVDKLQDYANADVAAGVTVIGNSNGCAMIIRLLAESMRPELARFACTNSMLNRDDHDGNHFKKLDGSDASPITTGRKAWFFHGESDGIIPFNGGRGILGYNFWGGVKASQLIAELYGVVESASSTSFGQTTVITYGSSQQVIMWSVKGEGHSCCRGSEDDDKIRELVTMDMSAPTTTIVTTASSTTATSTINTIATTLPATSTTAAVVTTTTTAGSGFMPVDGGVDRACRGNNSMDNSPSYYAVARAKSLDACKSSCSNMRTCVGIEYGRLNSCEIWTRLIGATANVKGYTCLGREANVDSLPTPAPIEFLPLDGGFGRVCRGKNGPGDNSNTYYLVQKMETLDACKARCAEVMNCEGLEWGPKGRCEVWTSTVGSSKSLPGYTCLRAVRTALTTSPFTTAVTPM